MEQGAMDPQTLKRLVVDRGLGELSPDVERLFDAYLSDHPSLRETTESIRSTMRDARRALVEPVRAQVPMPALPRACRGTVRQPHGKARMVAWWRPVAAAAAIVLAFFLGTAQQRPAQDGGQAPTVAARVVQAGHDRNAPREFWSLLELRGAYEARSGRETPRLEWPSPLRRPRNGGSS